VPEEIVTQLTAVETRLAAREQSQVSTAVGESHGETALKDKVSRVCHRLLLRAGSQ